MRLSGQLRARAAALCGSVRLSAVICGAGSRFPVYPLAALFSADFGLFSAGSASRTRSRVGM